MSDITKNISHIIKDACQLRLRSHVKNDDLVTSIKSTEISKDSLEGWLSLILVSSFDVRISFKIYFEIAAVTQLIENNMKNTISKIDNELIFDFMNEYCNLTAGMIQQTLSQQSIKVGISLPMTSRSFDDVYFSSHDHNVNKESWMLTADSIDFYCLSEVHILNPEAFVDFKYSISEESEQKIDDILGF